MLLSHFPVDRKPVILGSHSNETPKVFTTVLCRPWSSEKAILSARTETCSLASLLFEKYAQLPSYSKLLHVAVLTSLCLTS